MKKTFLFAGFSLALMLVGFLNGCKQDNPSEPLEPISLVQPDSAITQHVYGDSTPIQLKFTTDRPITWIQILYAIDTSGNINNTPALYPDTLYYKVFSVDSPQHNLYTYTGLFLFPPSLPDYSVVYFDASFNAGDASFVVGQNYPAGIVTGDKKFKIVVL